MTDADSIKIKNFAIVALCLPLTVIAVYGFCWLHSIRPAIDASLFNAAKASNDLPQAAKTLGAASTETLNTMHEVNLAAVEERKFISRPAVIHAETAALARFVKFTDNMSFAASKFNSTILPDLHAALLKVNSDILPHADMVSVSANTSLQAFTEVEKSARVNSDLLQPILRSGNESIVSANLLLKDKLPPLADQADKLLAVGLQSATLFNQRLPQLLTDAHDVTHNAARVEDQVAVGLKDYNAPLTWKAKAGRFILKTVTIVGPIAARSF